MKKIIKYSIVIFFFTAGVAYGQTTPPNKVVVDAKDYYQHGYNSSGGPNLPQEVRDSVTVTSVIKYFVLPDPTVSPNYKYDTPANTVDFSQVNSTFTWSLKNLLGVTNSSTTPIVTVTWGNTAGIDSVKVTEVANSNSSCTGPGTTIPVAVINKPTIVFNPKNALYADSACHTLTEVTTGVQYQFGVTATTQSSQIWVDYTVTKDGVAQSALNGTNVLVTGGQITLTFNDYGLYEVTLTKVTDRVSRKSTDASGNPITGEIASAGAKFKYHVMRPVQTGPIYRIPNNF